MKRILIAVALFVCILKANAQGKVKAHSITRLKDDSIVVTCDHEILASFPGGRNKFDQYLMKNIRYSARAIKANIQGKVLLNFVIEKDGRIDAVKIVKSLSPELDAEAVRVLKNSPKWRPTRNCGKPERTSYSIPIVFQIPKTKKSKS